MISLFDTLLAYISKNKLNRKLNTEIEFTVREVSEIFVLLNLSYNELWDIFFK